MQAPEPTPSPPAARAPLALAVALLLLASLAGLPEASASAASAAGVSASAVEATPAPPPAGTPGFLPGPPAAPAPQAPAAASSISPVAPVPQGNWNPVYGPVVLHAEAHSAGTGLRNQGSGTILLPGAVTTALQAYLYWEIQEPVPTPPSSVATLNGVPVTGTLIGSGPDLCWGAGMNWAYRADVTPLIFGPGPYTVTAASGTLGGSDPWVLGSAVPMAEGASLVVVAPAATPHEIVIVDGYESLIGTSAWAGIPRVAPSPWPSALATIGGDGQTAAPDRMDWNGALLALDAWDGSDPQAALPYTFGDLWDTDHWLVHAPPGLNVLALHGTLDCIGPEAFVLSTPVADPCPVRLPFLRGADACDLCTTLASVGLSCEPCHLLAGAPLCDPCQLLREQGLSCNPCDVLSPCDPCGLLADRALDCRPCDLLATFELGCEPCQHLDPCDPCETVRLCDPCGLDAHLLCQCLPPKVPRLKECLGLELEKGPAAWLPGRSLPPPAPAPGG